MKKIVFVLFLSIIVTFTGCSSKGDVGVSKEIKLTQQQKENFENQIKQFLTEKTWDFENNITFDSIYIPVGVKNTYYEDVIKKSQDCGLDLSKNLGNRAIEATINLKYPNSDIAGQAHFLFAQDQIVGAYYLIGNYIYSLNEKEVFKEKVKWKKIENPKTTRKYKEKELDLSGSLKNWGRYTKDIVYLFSYSNNKLKMFTLDENELAFQREIYIDGLNLVDMFFKDIDNDGKSELAVLVTANNVYSLMIYGIENGLKQKYSMDFHEKIMSINYDGENIIVTSDNAIEMLGISKDKLQKNYSYSKIGGTIIVNDIDGSGIPRYILVDSKGKDIYVFQKSKNRLTEIWRTYNEDNEYTNNIQIGDLNGDTINEIYVEDTQGNIRKIILNKDGFMENKDIIKGHKYFIGDFNNDKAFEYFDMINGENRVTYKY